MICSSGVGFDPTINGERLKFGFHGIWQGVAVLYDTKTKSHWLHLTGECIEGELKGTKLAPITGRHLLWREWKRDHPETEVMDSDPRFESNYFDRDSSKRGVDFFPRGFKRTIETLDNRLPPSTLCYGILVEGKAKAYAFPMLRLLKNGLLHDEFNGTPVLLTYDEETNSATAFDRRLDDKVLSFERDADGQLQDKESGSVFRRDGKAASGPHEGRQLPLLTGLQAEWYGWFASHPDTALWIGQ